jgi:hypothetical protein
MSEPDECRIVIDKDGYKIRQCDNMFPENNPKKCRRLEIETDRCYKGLPVSCSCYNGCKHVEVCSYYEVE